jgi:hypothetical protein
MADVDPLRTGLYLFCFARAPFPLDGQERGLELNQPLLQWTVEDVTAIVCPAVPNEFNGPGAEARLRDVGWVGPRALRHQQVVERVMRDSPVLPCRFGTLFSSPAVLLGLLKKLRPLIAPFLDYVADKEEWAVKGFLDAARTETWLRTSDPALIERTTQLSEAPGRRYFQEKQLITDVRQRSRLWAREVTQRIQKTLAAWALAVRSLRLPTTNAAARDMLFNSSLLVPHDRVVDLCAAVSRLNTQHSERGVTVELSGPWPPYSFSPLLDPDQESADEVSRLLHSS